MSRSFKCDRMDRVPRRLSKMLNVLNLVKFPGLGRESKELKPMPLSYRKVKFIDFFSTGMYLAEL